MESIEKGHKPAPTNKTPAPEPKLGAKPPKSRRKQTSNSHTVQDRSEFPAEARLPETDRD